MYRYEVRHPFRETMTVIAEDMSEALDKYHKYIDDTLSYDYSVDEDFKKITSCTLIGDYIEERNVIK